MDVEIIDLGNYDEIPVAEVLKAMQFAGLAEHINDPSQLSMTMEAIPTQAVMSNPVLQGPQGNPGRDAITLFFKNNIITDLNQIPTDLGGTVADIGKFWVYRVPDKTTGDPVATIVYVWTGPKGEPLAGGGIGDGFNQINVGSPGPPGPYPDASEHSLLNIVAQGNGGGPGDVDSWVNIDVHDVGGDGGTMANPAITWNLAAPRGIEGPTCPLGGMIDVDLQTNPPIPTDILVVSNRVTPAAPTGLGAVGHSTGGTLPAGTYYYGVTAVVPNGETVVSNIVGPVTVTGTTSSAALTWTIPTGNGATGFRVYRGTSPTVLDQLVGVVISGTWATFTDIGALTAPGTPPTTGIPAGLDIWVPGQAEPSYPTFYTAPQAAFIAAAGIEFGGSEPTILNFTIPAQPWPYIPMVLAQAKVTSINLGLTPLQMGAQILLNGTTQVAAGNGNTLGSITVASDFSSLAVSPTSPGAALVAADTPGPLTMKLINLGLIDVFDFQPSSDTCYLGVMCVPCISGEGA